MPRCETATVLGGGAFGTAMAQVLARNGTETTMWVREAEVVEEINSHHTNSTFLSGVPLSPNIKATTDLQESLKDIRPGGSIVLIVIPTQFLRSVMDQYGAVLPVGVPLVCCAKGIESTSLLTPWEILVEELPGKYHGNLAALSGPSFAKEVAIGIPTNVLCASKEESVASFVQHAMSDVVFRVYTGSDVIGAELCGAVKNVLAIACGAAHGAGLGHNTTALLISRGLFEMTKLAIVKGAHPSTMTGLAGVGDLLLTCTSQQSRNFTVGKRIAQGETLEQITATVSSVAEGVKTSVSVRKLAEELHVEMPICTTVYQVLHEGKTFAQALAQLQSRPLSAEVDPFSLLRERDEKAAPVSAASATRSTTKSKL